MSSFSISPSQSRSQSPSPTRPPKLTITKPPSRRSSVQSSSSFNHKQTDSNSPLPSAIEPPSNYLFPSLRNFPHNDLSASGNGKRSIWKRIILWLGDVKVEQHGKRRLVLSMVFYLICGYINVIFCNLAELRRAELYKRGFSRTLILPDLGHDYVPHLDIPFLPDYFIISLGVATVILISKHQHRLGILRRFFYVHGTLLLFRSLTIISTTLPDPQKKCSLPRIERGLFDSFNPFFSDTCGDLVFSGHTVVLTLLTMIWEDYGPKKWYIQRIVQLDACLGILSLLSTRYHYTIDVIIAFYLARRGWKWYGMITKSPHLRSSDPVITYLERRSSEKDFEAFREVVYKLDKQRNDVVGKFVSKVDEFAGRRKDEVAKEFDRLLKEWSRMILSRVKKAEEAEDIDDDEESEDEGIDEDEDEHLHDE